MSPYTFGKSTFAFLFAITLHQASASYAPRLFYNHIKTPGIMGKYNTRQSLYRSIRKHRSTHSSFGRFHFKLSQILLCIIKHILAPSCTHTCHPYLDHNHDAFSLIQHHSAVQLNALGSAMENAIMHHSSLWYFSQSSL